MAIGAVQAEDRKPRRGIDVRCNRRAGVAIAAKAMFGRVDRFDLDLTMMPDRIDDRFESRRDAALIGDDPDGTAMEIAPCGLQEDLVAEPDACRRGRLGSQTTGRGDGAREPGSG
jgi:hypothetical protein